MAGNASSAGRLGGFTPFPEHLAERYRALGYWRGKALFSLLREGAERRPDAVAVVCGERRLSYAALCQRSEQLASGLHELGLRPRDRVLVQMPNVAEFLEVCLALFRLGALPVMAHPAHRLRELESFAQQTQASALFIAERHAGFDYRELARALSRRAPALRHVIVSGDADEFIELQAVRSAARSGPSASSMAEPGAEEVALLQLSGGSTGTPKLIPRTHEDYACGIGCGARAASISARTTYLVALPAAHNFPLSSPGSLGVLFAGGKVVMAPRPDPPAVFPLIEREHVTLTSLVPSLLFLWSEAKRFRREDVSSLEVLQVGGAKLPVAAAARVRATFGCQLQQVFGMAEGLVCYTRLDDTDELVTSSQGVPGCSADELRIVDDADADVPEGEVGHLLVRGPYTVRGYYAAEEHNRRAFTESGFYRTGDRVRRLPSGHLVVEGRSKDQINRGGEKIAAQEVELALLGHADVAEVALIGMADKLLGERSCAIVVRRRSEASAAALQQFLEQAGLAAYKWPDRYEFVEQLPRTTVGKIDKAALSQWVAAQRGGVSLRAPEGHPVVAQRPEESRS